MEGGGKKLENGGGDGARCFCFGFFGGGGGGVKRFLVFVSLGLWGFWWGFVADRDKESQRKNKERPEGGRCKCRSTTTRAL